jgi:hypothetical protein
MVATPGIQEGTARKASELGVSLPSVTEILKSVGLMPEYWGGDRPAQLGTAVHRACHFDDEGDLDEATVDPEVLPCLGGWRRFKREIPIRIFGNEVEVEHPLGYIGHTDKIVEFINTVRCGVIDLKSGIPHRWHAAQAMAYRAAVRAMAAKLGLTPEQVASLGAFTLYLSKKSAGIPYKLVEHTNPRDWRIFQAALIVHNGRVEYGVYDRDRETGHRGTIDELGAVHGDGAAGDREPSGA